MLSCPSQSAMTVMSIPAVSNRIAAVCLSTCGVTVLVDRLGQDIAAVAVCNFRRAATAPRLIWVPVRVGNTNPSASLGRSVVNAVRTCTVCRSRGVVGFLRPLPWQSTCAPTPRWTSRTWSAVSSLTRSPAVTASWNIAWSRRPAPGRPVRRCQQRGDLGVGEVADLVAGSAFGWDGQYSSDGGQVFGVVARCVGEERVHRGQSGVAGGDAVVALGLQAGEESVDQVRVELGEVQLCRCGCGRLCGVAEQQPPGVTVCRDCVRAGPVLAGQSGAEEGLQGGRQCCHEPSFCW